jgi:hypothetical protein
MPSTYLRLQADRCQRLSRSCMDLRVARDLRLMAEECYAEASRIDARDLDALDHTGPVLTPAADSEFGGQKLIVRYDWTHDWRDDGAKAP